MLYADIKYKQHRSLGRVSSFLLLHDAILCEWTINIWVFYISAKYEP